MSKEKEVTVTTEELVVNQPTTDKPEKCVFVSDGVYKYVPADEE